MTLKIGDHEKVDVTSSVLHSFCVGTEQNHSFGREGAYYAIDRAIEKARQPI